MVWSLMAGSLMIVFKGESINSKDAAGNGRVFFICNPVNSNAITKVHSACWLSEILVFSSRAKCDTGFPRLYVGLPPNEKCILFHSSISPNSLTPSIQLTGVGPCFIIR